MPKANGGEGRWVGGRERNEGRMEGRRVRYRGWKERQFCFLHPNLNFPYGKFGVFMQISKFYLGEKLVQEIFKNKNIP
jgi:hypothetical protein